MFVVLMQPGRPRSVGVAGSGAVLQESTGLVFDGNSYTVQNSEDACTAAGGEVAEFKLMQVRCAGK